MADDKELAIAVRAAAKQFDEAVSLATNAGLTVAVEVKSTRYDHAGVAVPLLFVTIRKDL